jgi:hypothetical protein
MAFGTALHGALNSFFSEGDPYLRFNMYWNSIKDSHLEYDRYTWEDLGTMATNVFIPNFIRLHSKKFKNPKLEETIEMPFLGEHTLQGTFDIAADYEGKLGLWDYKTSAREYPHSKIYRNPQLYIYARLYQHKYNELPEHVGYKVFIKSEKRIQTLKRPLTQSILDNMMGNVEAIARDMISRKEFYCNYANCYCTTPKECFKD